MSQSVIAIVGAGLSGLVCARILQQRGISVTVYEMDASASARQQGGSLDMHADAGQVALREAGLHEAFSKKTHVGGEALRVLDKNARVYIDHDERNGGNGRPEIDREALRSLLVDSLEPGTIIWGSKLTKVQPAERGHTLQFSDGTSTRADLVIGADGAWSKVRAALTTVKPQYTGITLVEIRLANATTEHPAALATVGQGSLFTLSDNKYIGGHGGDQIALGLGMRVFEDWITTSGINWENPAETREALLREFSDWATPLTDLIKNADDSIWPRPISALPVGHTWPHQTGLTLLGDAAHLMSPFAGEGANLALIDGADLARAILTVDNIDTAVKVYEKKMFRRGAKSAKTSRTSLAMMFNDEAPRKLVRFFRRIILLSSLLRPLQRLLTRG